MSKTYFLTFLSVVTVSSLLTGCKKKVAPLSERIAKVWTANTVDENSQTVYTRGGTSNVRNYASFKLDLSQPPAVTYTEFDGNTFRGQYSLPNDQTLRLTDLSPQPTGTNGTIEFTINDITDNTLKLTRTTASQKTGNTNNVYNLTNP